MPRAARELEGSAGERRGEVERPGIAGLVQPPPAGGALDEQRARRREALEGLDDGEAGLRVEVLRDCVVIP